MPDAKSPNGEGATGIDSMAIPRHRKVLYLCVMVLFLFAICEGGLRFRAWLKYGSAATSVRDPMLVRDDAAGLWVPRPGFEIKGANIHIKINSLGFRGEEFSKTKPPGTVRIVALGASTTFSSEASSNAAIWTARLQDKLRRANPNRNIEVINAAVGGYVSDDNLRNLRSRVLPLDPDLVIYYEANNEIVRDTRELAMREGFTGDGRQQPGWAAALSRVSLMFDLFYKNVAILARSQDSGAPRLDRIPPELPQHFIGTLDQMRRELAERHIPILLSTFIVKYRANQDRATQIANADVAFFYMPWMSIDGMLDAMDRYNAAIIDYGKQTGTPVVDDREMIPADAEHFADCMHLADKGNEVMAERFFRFIMASSLLPRER
jgi:lysophospholipase L1-like esterase